MSESAFFGKLGNIFNGWTNYIIKTPRIEKMAEVRALVCARCPAAVECLIQIPDTNTEVKGMKCDDCGCPLSAKIRSEDEKCPRDKWKDLTY